MKLTVKEVLDAAGKQGIAPLMLVDGLEFETALKLAQTARKLEDELKVIQGRIEALREKHDVQAKLKAILEKHGLPQRAPEDEWTPECDAEVQAELGAFTKDLDSLMGAEIEVVVSPVTIPRGKEGVTAAMLFNVLKFVEVA
jgi:hypothetical protein